MHRKISKEVEEVTIDKRVIDPEKASLIKHPLKWEVGPVSSSIVAITKEVALEVDKVLPEVRQVELRIQRWLVGRWQAKRSRTLLCLMVEVKAQVEVSNLSLETTKTLSHLAIDYRPRSKAILARLYMLGVFMWVTCSLT